MSCAFSPSHLSWYLCCNIFYLPFVDLEWMDLNFEIAICKVFRRFHHHHFLKLFLKTYGFSYQTAMSNNCYYLFSFYQWSTRLSNYLPRSHTANLVQKQEKNLAVLICVFMFNLQSRHRLLWSDGTTNLKLNIQELLTKTQANSIFTISVRTSPSCQQLLNFHLNIWQSKTCFLLSVLLQDGIQAYC